MKSTYTGDGMGYVGGGNVGYWRYTVSDSGIWLQRAIGIDKIHT